MPPLNLGAQSKMWLDVGHAHGLLRFRASAMFLHPSLNGNPLISTTIARNYRISHHQ